MEKSPITSSDEEGDGIPFNTAEDLRAEVLKKIKRKERELFISYNKNKDITHLIEKVFKLHSKFKECNRVLFNQLKQLKIANSQRFHTDSKKVSSNLFSDFKEYLSKENSQKYKSAQTYDNIQNILNSENIQNINQNNQIPTNLQNGFVNGINPQVRTKLNSFNPSHNSTSTPIKSNTNVNNGFYNPGWNNSQQTETHFEQTSGRPFIFDDFKNVAVYILNRKPRMTLFNFNKEYNSFENTPKIRFMELGEGKLKSLFERIPSVQVHFDKESSKFYVTKNDVVCFPFRRYKKCECGLDCDGRKGFVSYGWRTKQCVTESMGLCKYGVNCNMLHTRSLYI